MSLINGLLKWLQGSSSGQNLPFHMWIIFQWYKCSSEQSWNVTTPKTQAVTRGRRAELCAHMSKLCTEKVTFIKIMATLRDTAGAWGSLYFCLTRCHTRHNTGSFPQVTTFKYICHSNPTHHTRIKGRKQSTRYRKARKYTAVQPDIFPHAYQKSWTIHI